MQEAPLFENIAGGPDGGVAHWLKTADGLRIRVGLWNMAKAKGTVFIFPGRSEYVEKYGTTACALQDRGYASLAIDWRGQGIADRVTPNRAVGDVRRFADYQHDVAAVVAYAEEMNLPRPFYMIAHSMGGCIGLRAMTEGLDIAAAMFSAPMWGMQLSPYWRFVAWGLSSISKPLGFETSLALNQFEESYVLRAEFAENTLTGDPDNFAAMRNQLVQQPDLGLGGPSYRWINQALLETRRLSLRRAPDIPCLTYLGSEDAVFDHARIRNRMATWQNGKLRVIAGGRHEMLIDRPSIRIPIFDETGAFFDAHHLSVT
jgi:lysophospholipase